MLFYLWILVILAAVYLYYRRVFSKFSRHGVKNDPTWPVLGNMVNTMLRIGNRFDEIRELYLKYPDERFIGRYEFNKPLLLIRDLELVKQVTVKDFENFVDRRTFIDEKTDPLFGRNLLSLKGQEWKDMRSTLSPAFTSAKMKSMLPLIVEVGEQMNKVLKAEIEQSGVGYLDLDMKDLTTRYANDVIASCAFGLKVSSHAERDNEFYLAGKDTFNFDFSTTLKFFGLVTFPYISKKILKLQIFSEYSKKFFRTLVSYTMKEREEKNIIRPDMIHLLMEAKKGKLLHEEKESTDEGAGFATVEESSHGRKGVTREWSDDDLTAQALLFFLAGFETVSTMMSFVLYELARSPAAQARLLAEIRQHDASTGGEFHYNSIQQMPYMDMVVSEVMRLWAPLPAVDRVCMSDYNIGKPNKDAKEDYIIRKGEAIAIPTWGFHRDPRYFPDPDKFDPERFSDENKHNIVPFTYMPFGYGPRNCIGSRFALCEVKVMVYQLLKTMEVSPCEKTVIPVKLRTDSFQLRIIGGDFLRLKLRK